LIARVGRESVSDEVYLRPQRRLDLTGPFLKTSKRDSLRVTGLLNRSGEFCYEVHLHAF
jgi:hypothetical protein